MRPAVVMDCGTGYTKLGFAGNVQPSFVIPTVVGTSISKNKAKPDALEDLDYMIGNEAAANPTSCNLSYPIRQGVVENWDHMEKFWQSCIWQQLQVNPEDHNFVLTEPPLNPPENREYTAEIMFETFNAAGLFIGVQAVLALYASFAMADHKQEGTGSSLTGTVIDAGEGVTHIIPVVDGYVIGSSIKSMPLAGRDVTLFVQQLLRERGEPVPPEMSLDISRQIKERFCYTCSDIAKEFARHDADPAKYLKQFTGVNPRTGKEFLVDIAYERFMAPEMFFNPEVYSSSVTTPLPQVVDDVIQSCPIDTRRALYSSIVLSGGCTMLKDYGKRLQRDVKAITSARLRPGAPEIDVNVVGHQLQRYAVWFGGSVLAMTPEFPAACHTRQQYEEYGPSICRSNYVFRNV